HSDDDGLILPPKLAPIQVVIVPIYKNEEQLQSINDCAEKIMAELRQKNISVKYDNRDTYKPGWKFAEYELKGVPVRISIGPRDLENQSVEVARRDTKEKTVIQLTDLSLKIEHLLDQIQENIYNKAVNFRETKTFKADSLPEFIDILDKQGGFVYAH